MKLIDRYPMEGIYKVNLIPCDLSTEESILQIADTLDNLNGIVDDVFTRLMDRIKQNVDKTIKLKHRIDISRNRVEKLTGIQKAIKVFSSAKYPASITHVHYQSIFGLDGYHHEPRKVVLSGKTVGQSDDTRIQEKLHFYHVEVAQSKNPKPKQDFNLNAIIDDVSTVGELLVLNTDESPYFGTKSRVPAYVPKVTPSVENKSLLEAPPSSIVNRDLLRREADEYLYAPGMGMVPELEMPLDLPHLPGIAGDVQFSFTNDGSIAPSVVTSPVTQSALPDASLELPDLDELPDLSKLPDVKLPESVPDLPAPPRPVVPAASTSRALAPPPPPPPPPPPIAVDYSPVAGEREEKPRQEPLPAAGDAHSNLMAAIRQGAKLRPAAAPEPRKNQKSGGELMADLHNKLQMRRQGISGSERARGGSLLHTLASVIPEPGEQSTPQLSSGEDEWEE